jgi:hypothetical protein
MRGGAGEFLDQTQFVGEREGAEARGDRRAHPHRVGQRVQQAIERLILAEEEELLLAAKVVIEVAGGEIRGRGDVAHPGCGEAAVVKDARGGAQDFEPSGVRALLDAAAPWRQPPADRLH